MSLLETPLTKDDFLNSGWQDVVNNSEIKECFSYHLAFWQKAEEAKEAGNIKAQTIFEILAIITPNLANPYPVNVFQNLPLTDEALNFLNEIVTEIPDPELQARVADILWVKKRNYRMAQYAITAYRKAATELEKHPKSWNKCFARIERALRLSRRISYQVEASIAYIEKVLERYNGEDPQLLSAKLMELLQDSKSGDPQKYAPLAEKAARLAESNSDWYRARYYWQIKAKWHLIEKDAEEERAASMLAAETYVKEAEDARKNNPNPYSAATHFLEEAIKAFRRIRGTQEEREEAQKRAEEVHKLMLLYQKQSVQEMKTIYSEPTDISQLVERARKQVSGKKLQDALFTLALSEPPLKVSYFQEQVKEDKLSQFMPLEMINDMGKVVASQSSDPKNSEKNIRFAMYRMATGYQDLQAQAFIEPARDQINLEHSIRLEDLLPIVSNSPFVPPERDYLFAKGLYAGLTGDFFASTHILIPQIENSVRYILEQRGVITSGLDDRGIQKEHYLNTTLYRPEITSIFDEDTLFDLKGLLVEHSGSNLRNRMAHGLMSDQEFSSPLMSYLWWVTLRLCCLPIWIYQQKIENSDPWVKFAGMFEDDPLFDEFVEDMAAYRRELDAEVEKSEVSSEENESA